MSNTLLNENVEECLKVLFHTEFLSTLCRIKPLSIIRTTFDSDLDEAWVNGWKFGVLKNLDLVWKQESHPSGSALWVGSRCALAPLLKRKSTNSCKDELSTVKELSKTFLPDSEEFHTFWGTMLGYPKSQIGEYAKLGALAPTVGVRVPIYPESFGSITSGSFRAGDPLAHDVTKFLERNARAASTFVAKAQTGVSLMAMFNEWDTFF